MSGVPCVVEQSALVMFYEGRSAVTTVANLWDISLITNISSSWIDLHSQVNQCSNKSLDYLNCLMRDEQCRIIPFSFKASSGSKVVLLTRFIFVLSCFGPWLLPSPRFS